jgi:dipeptidyl aminopeptidase/acylaminoacyl peptidase
VALIYPNVRGSAGYGKSYLLLDNGRRREDSVKDIGALLDWIQQQPDLDPSRVMVSGGSYGGYMVLAVLVHYGSRLRCAYESVGISNFVTFLENTSEYRRDQRRVEYGDERIAEMRTFLEKISPARQAERINRPLLVAQGANDPRVPISESEQIVAAVEKNGAPVWYVVGKDEGHGFQKKVNTDYMRVVMIEFIREHLLGAEAAARALTPDPSPASGRGV